LFPWDLLTRKTSVEEGEAWAPFLLTGQRISMARKLDKISKLNSPVIWFDLIWEVE
jgi:hypothetical protein